MAAVKLHAGRQNLEMKEAAIKETFMKNVEAFWNAELKEKVWNDEAQEAQRSYMAMWTASKAKAKDSKPEGDAPELKPKVKSLEEPVKALPMDKPKAWTKENPGQEVVMKPKSNVVLTTADGFEIKGSPEGVAKAAKKLGIK